MSPPSSFVSTPLVCLMNLPTLTVAAAVAAAGIGSVVTIGVDTPQTNSARDVATVSPPKAKSFSNSNSPVTFNVTTVPFLLLQSSTVTYHLCKLTSCFVGLLFLPTTTMIGTPAFVLEYSKELGLPSQTPPLDLLLATFTQSVWANAV